MYSINFPIVPPVIAHRGASAEAPENTLAAFLKAKQMGVKWIEFDVMLAECGEVVVIHDETLERTTMASGLVIDCPYSYLKTLDAGSWFNASYSRETIPTLRDVLVFLQAHGMNANIELKAQVGHEEILVKKVLVLIDQLVKENGPQLLLSSFSLLTLESLRQYSSSCLLGFLMDRWTDSWEKICDRLNCISVNVNYVILDFEKITSIKSTNRWLLSYTVNQVEHANQLFALGVDAVFSDCPDKILKGKI